MKYTRYELEAMTTNERLFSTGLLPEFDEACDRNDLERVRKILEDIYVDELSIARTLADIAAVRRPSGL